MYWKMNDTLSGIQKWRNQQEKDLLEFEEKLQVHPFMHFKTHITSYEATLGYTYACIHANLCTISLIFACWPTLVLHPTRSFGGLCVRQQEKEEISSTQLPSSMHTIVEVDVLDYAQKLKVRQQGVLGVQKSSKNIFRLFIFLFSVHLTCLGKRTV